MLVNYGELLLLLENDQMRRKLFPRGASPIVGKGVIMERAEELITLSNKELCLRF